MPLISFIVPVYNCECYIKQCLESIRVQTINDFEVIVIDDGSTDQSGTICDDYANLDNRFVVIHKKNEGLSAARNDGIALAKGEWITFVDSDDWVEPFFLQTLLDHMDVDLVITSVIKHYKHCNVEIECFTESLYTTIDQSVFACENLITGFFTAWTKFYKASIVKKNELSFIPGVSPGEDTIFVLQYINNINSVYLSSIPCYNWRVANGLTNRKRSFELIKYTINMSMTSIQNVENRFKVCLQSIKYNSLQYLLDKIDVKKCTFVNLYHELNEISKMKWMQEVVNDKEYLVKGKQRCIVDFLFQHNLYGLLAFFCRLTGRFYS